MSGTAPIPDTFASGRYSKRKRTQITYVLDELDVSDSDSDFESQHIKKRKASPASRPLPKHKVFPFMKLPAEIRNMIYTYALTDPASINLVATFKHRRRTVERVSFDLLTNVSKSYYSTSRLNDQVRAQYKRPKSLAPSLLAVSKQIHSEARDMLYSNEFIFAGTFALYAFLINLGPSGSKHLKTIRLLSWEYGRGMKAYNHACFAVLVWATNITSFYIDTSIGWYRNPKTCAEQIYRDAFPWLEAVARTTGKADGAIDVLKCKIESFESRQWNGTSSVIVPGDERYKEFQAALSKLLDAQQKRVMAKPAKKRKTLRGVVTDEL
ncbi:hypothetical protein BKA66DRAFT_572967 [Pyrenochaeta sp. MPI-SDFR-AT-0127]|nr:hypothetical protein BKA66DRAFT_572967 [Pyrenochaeta sp. MPI-SDFR-AT-0127]